MLRLTDLREILRYVPRFRDRVFVIALDGLVQRLMEMGLLEGEEVEVVGFAPMGDPMEVRLGDYRLSLRRVEAARVHVEPL
jgi:ferrous iron transport protein A